MDFAPQPSLAPRPPRLMHVKVLYTFDDDNRTNCLVRCNTPLSVQTAFLGPQSEIGIIELRVCVQAIVQASPELVAKLGQDYTVYAYDYSEYETPLVGQGMLSWVLASVSSTPNAPADESKTMVTGRVKRGGLGLFSSTTQETLEVKLRLVPVPTALQSEYQAGMERYRDASTVVRESIDSVTWTNFLRANPGFGNNAAETPETVSRPQQGASWPILRPEIASTPVPEARPSQAPRRPQTAVAHIPGQIQFTEIVGPQSYGAPSRPPPSRPVTPISQRRALCAAKGVPRSSAAPPSKASKPERPTLRHSASATSRLEGQPSGQIRDTDDAVGPQPKRARVEQAEWHGHSSFQSNSESLRIAASAAASMRGSRLSTTATELAASNPGNRPPTPKPRAMSVSNPRPLKRSRSSLGQPAMVPSDGPELLEESMLSPDATNISPEKQDADSINSTPMDIPSSPPILRRPSPALSVSSLPPPHPSTFQDSGFASGGFDDLDFEHGNLTAVRATKPIGRPSFLNLQSELSVTGDQEVEINQPPQPERREPSPPKPRKRPSTTGLGSSPRPSPAQLQAEENGLTRMSVENDANVETSVQRQILSRLGDAVSPNDIGQQQDTRERSTTYHTEDFSQAGSPPLTHDIGMQEAGGDKSRKTGSSNKRKRAIKNKLAAALEAGIPPPFCDNCGEINTPTWRKACRKIFPGSPSQASIPEEHRDGVLAIELIKDGSGDSNSFRVIKKVVDPKLEGYEEFSMCNSCGLWLSKFKTMRPPDRSNPQSKGPPPPRKRPNRKRKPKESGIQSEPAAAPAESEPAEEDPNTTAHATRVAAEDLQHNHNIPDEPGQRNSDALPKSQTYSIAHSDMAFERARTRTAAAAALQRAIQSSPPRFPGSKCHPINLEQDSDATHLPTRRSLFPSPRKLGETKCLDSPSIDGSPSKSSGTGKPDGTVGKENQTPPESTRPDAADESNWPRTFPDDERDDLLSLADKYTNGNEPHTPRSTRSSARLRHSSHHFSTPPSKRRTPLTSRTKDYLSAAARRFRDREDSPPTLSPTQPGDLTLPMEAFPGTPFTEKMNRIISQAGGTFDLPSPGRGQGHAINMTTFTAEGFGFEEFQFDENALVSGGMDIDALTSDVYGFEVYDEVLTGDHRQMPEMVWNPELGCAVDRFTMDEEIQKAAAKATRVAACDAKTVDGLPL